MTEKAQLLPVTLPIGHLLNSETVGAFWSHVDRQGPEMCWEWNGLIDQPTKKHSFGYGIFKIGQQQYRAHRVSYTIANGEIASGLVIDHLCRNTKCVNPAHLEAVSNVENVMRGLSEPALNKQKTHCKRGHPLSGDNILSTRGKRECRKCRRVNSDHYTNMRRGKIAKGTPIDWSAV